jgi:hypothetical protein
VSVGSITFVISLLLKRNKRLLQLNWKLLRRQASQCFSISGMPMMTSLRYYVNTGKA